MPVRLPDTSDSDTFPDFAEYVNTSMIMTRKLPMNSILINGLMD